MSTLLTKEVCNVIEKLIDESKINNSTIHMNPGTVTGDNYLGVITNVIVNGLDKDGNKKKLNLIVKTATQNEEFREALRMDEMFKREVYFYNTIFPKFQQFQIEKGFLELFNPFAKLYKYSLQKKQEVMIMENMKLLGYKLQDRTKILDYEHVSFVVKQYGKFHALSFALRDQKPEEFQKMVDACEENFFRFSIREKMTENLNICCDRAMKTLNPETNAIEIQKFKNYRKNVFDLLIGVLEPNVAGKYGVLGHGDCWINNLLFKYDNQEEPNSPTKLCILDWQLARYGSPVLDLSYFIFASTDKNLRDEYYDILLNEYYESLSTFLHKLGSDPDKLFPREIFQEHLEKFSSYGLTLALMIIKLMLSEGEETIDFAEMTEEERIQSFNSEFKQSHLYEDRVRDIIIDCCRLNYI